LLTTFRVRLVTEDLPSDDVEGWRENVILALRGNRRELLVNIEGTNIDPRTLRAVIVLTVQARTGSGAVEMLNEVLRRMGEHPELFAIRRLYLYPEKEADEAMREQFDDIIDGWGPDEWERIDQMKAADYQENLEPD
jgi:hypothetical protein